MKGLKRLGCDTAKEQILNVIKKEYVCGEILNRK